MTYMQRKALEAANSKQRTHQEKKDIFMFMGLAVLCFLIGLVLGGTV